MRARGLVAYAFDPLAPDLVVDDDDDDKTLNDPKVDRLSRAAWLTLRRLSSC